jgi:hypothetical protein
VLGVEGQYALYTSPFHPARIEDVEEIDVGLHLFEIRTMARCPTRKCQVRLIQTLSRRRKSRQPTKLYVDARDVTRCQVDNGRVLERPTAVPDLGH